MTTKKIEVQRFTAISSKSFQDVLAKLDAAIGHPNMAAFRNDMTSAKSFADLEAAVQKVIGTAGLMEFARFDLGEVLRRKLGERARRSVRLVVGNPIIMAHMVEHVPDAGSYAPVTILVDERSDGVHLTYDKMASFLSTYHSPEASKVAQALDSKVEALLSAAAASSHHENSVCKGARAFNADTLAPSDANQDNPASRSRPNSTSRPSFSVANILES